MNDDETLENKTTNHEPEAVKRKKAEKPRPVLDDQWRPPMFLNPWARAFDGDSLPDEPFMGSNKRPKQLSDMLPRPQPGVVRGRGRPAAVRAGNHAMNTKGNAHDEQ